MESDNMVNCKSYKALATIFDEEFDYDETLNTYMDKMPKCLRNPALSKGHWTRKRVEKMIKKINRNKNLPASERDNGLKLFDKELDTAILNGELILVFANSCLQILPYEDSFDVMADLHRQMYHAGFDKMQEVLQKHFFILKDYKKIFLESCNVCNKYKSFKADQLSKLKNRELLNNEDVLSFIYKQAVEYNALKNTDLKTFNETVKVDFIDMSLSPDHEFKHILMYYDNATQYILLRPLVEVNEDEIAMEIFRIFTDFGPPKKIETSEMTLLEKVMIILKRTPIIFTTLIIPKYFPNERDIVRNYFIEWMNTSKSSNWATCCYIVQYYLNLQGQENPMKKLFGERQQSVIPIFNTNQDGSSHKTTEESDDNDDDSNTNVDSIFIDDKTNTPAPSTSIDDASKESEANLINECCFKCERLIYFNVYKCIACNRCFHVYCAFRKQVEAGSANKSILCYKCRSCYNKDDKSHLNIFDCSGSEGTLNLANCPRFCKTLSHK